MFLACIDKATLLWLFGSIITNIYHTKTWMAY